LAFTSAIAGCAQEGGGRAQAAVAVAGCPVCSRPQGIGAVLSAAVIEASGLAVSATYADVLYTHNDSGDVPRFFAMTRTGGDLGGIVVTGAGQIDWEDMAVGPCAGGAGSCLYFADFGDNMMQRAVYALYRTPEPAKIGSGVPHEPLLAEIFPFMYPDGSRNAETLLVHPATGAVTVLTKVHQGASPVFEVPMPLTPGRAATLIRAGEIAPPAGMPRYTGGAVHPKGRGVLLRTYTNLLFHPMREGETVAQALAGAPCEVPVADEAQGETVAWLPSGDAYITLSEGEGATIYRVTCSWP
jgi:hypothetical protein